MAEIASRVGAILETPPDRTDTVTDGNVFTRFRRMLGGTTD